MALKVVIWFYEFSYQQGVPGGPAGLDHIRTSATSQSGSNRSVGLPSGQGATAPLESNSGKMLPVDVLCKNCRKEANFMCSACKSVHYCSIDCQVKFKKSSTVASQIREQMSGPDLHVFTLKFLALKKLVFPP